MRGLSCESLSLDSTNYMIHHVFLPPGLPQEDDFDPHHENSLLENIDQALRLFRDAVKHDEREIVQSVITMVQNLRLVRSDSGAVSEGMLERSLRALPKKGGAIPIHVKAQNAGIIISNRDHQICFETFELSPLNESVITTRGRLRRSFPASAIVVPQSTFEDDGFQTTFAQTIARLSHQAASGTKPKVRKAYEMHDEERDTTHPGLVTEYLTSVLKGTGKPVQASMIWKNTREEVLYKDTLKPWRRSPAWLLVRVAMQLGFSRSGASKKSPKGLYKAFMAFFLSHILTLSLKHAMQSDILYVMNAKLSRRLIKLGANEDFLWIDAVGRAMSAASRLIKVRWQDLMRQSFVIHDLRHVQSVQPEADTNINLPELDSYLFMACQSERHTRSFSFDPTSSFPHYPADELPQNLSNSTGDCHNHNLIAFESWVEMHLSRWLDRHIKEVTTCGQLKNLMETYHGCASSRYDGNPETNSIMILTIMELWTACDKSACIMHELLLDYDPEVPIELLQSLHLPLKCQMSRLHDIEEYIIARRARIKLTSPSIFRDFAARSAFSLRYFNQSAEQQVLLSRIESQAALDRDYKRRELAQKKEEYWKLMRLADQCDCEYYEDVDMFDGTSRTRHSSLCKKCRYEKQASSINIEVHEWPLPHDRFEKQSAVFELMVPVAFGEWRDATTLLLVDVLGSEYSDKSHPQARHSPQTYRGLSLFFTPIDFSTPRFGILSEAKPHISTHRRDKYIASMTESEVCLRNGMRYQYYDATKDVFTSILRRTDKVLDLCTYKLPCRSSSLQKFLSRPPCMPDGTSPNRVLARQSDCPDHMSLEEFKAFGDLPFGHRIQWTSILTQLAAPSLDFTKVETNLLLLQIIHQAGPPGKEHVQRDGHVVLTDVKFGTALLNKLQDALQRVMENWDSFRALADFAHVAARLLTLSTSAEVQRRCMEYLARARGVAFGWVNMLRDRAHGSTDDAQRTDYMSKTVDVALTCISTFDIDQDFLESVLASPNEASVLIQSSIIIQEYLRSTLGQRDRLRPMMLERWERLLYRGCPLLTKEVIHKRSPCLNDAIKKAWSDFQPGGLWTSVQNPYQHWLRNITASRGNLEALEVHINLLTAELLVNGRPLARLPSMYENHPTFATLFGRSILEVVPSRVPGMDFSARRAYAGYTVHFGMQSAFDRIESPGPHLLLQAMQNDRRYDLLPSSVFRGKVPVAFVDEFVHWFDHAGQSIELRPLEHPWTSSPANWRLRKVGCSWHLEKDKVVLVDIFSETARVISGIISVIEEPQRIHMLLHKATGSLDIQLPRLKLTFYRDRASPSIYSRQFRGLSVDSNQDIGALYGLRNKIVLKHDEERHNRLVIIPDGHIAYRKESDATVVSVDSNTAQRIHAYWVDKRLFRMVDNGSLQSKLFLAYLHGLTSYCLPDSLTGRTGTEQALTIVGSAFVHSFDVLTSENLSTLERIAKLTPGRKYYPAYERVMQTVQWDPQLSFLSQHSSFYTSVKAIFDHANNRKMFYPDLFIEPPSLDFVDSHLLDRDLLRSSTFRTSGFGAEQHTLEYDVEYVSQDRYQDSERATNAFVIARLVFQNRAVLHSKTHPQLREYLWNRLRSCATVDASDVRLDESLLKFDSQWLDNPSRRLGAWWHRIHASFGFSGHRYNKFLVMTWLSAAAFAKDTDLHVIHTLVALYCIPDVARIAITSSERLDLSYGAEISIDRLKSLIRPTRRAFSSCPEFNLATQTFENEYAAKQRRARLFQSRQDTAIQGLAGALAGQWPCEVPSNPSGHNFDTYVSMGPAMRSVREEFRTCFRNRCFHEYLGRLENELRRQTVEPVPYYSYTLSPPSPPSPPSCAQEKKTHITVDDIFRGPAPFNVPDAPASLDGFMQSKPEEGQISPRVRSLLAALQDRASFKYEEDYVTSLRESMTSLQHLTKWKLEVRGHDIAQVLRCYLADCTQHVEKLYSAMTDAINGYCRTFHATTASAHQWLRTSPSFFLQQLTQRRWKMLTEAWKTCIVKYGLALTEVQRAERLVKASENFVDIENELLNTGHRNWNPRDFPESLLVEIESGILIRDVQEDIAHQMRTPPSDQNVVMQMNMGEGKSSVIVPIVAAALADGTRLVRVFVAKPQSKQMFHMLVSKLGGLLDRRVYHLPFSRALRLDTSQADTIGSICRECMVNGGVLLVQPEHVLSLKLMGIECAATGRESLAKSLLQTQRFFDAKSRDIVDESDENFNVKFELIYTMGTQRPIELSPERWDIILFVLGLVARFAAEVKYTLPQSIEIESRWRGRHPRIRFLRPDAQKMVLERIADHICNVGFVGFPIARQPRETRRVVHRYITEPDLTAVEVARVEDGSLWTESTRKPLLLLRGLIAGGVLSFAFGAKRWRVDYGLDLDRKPNTKVAVPFRAKDSPTPRSEFSHPDVVIILTSLSYYYGGLDNDDLFIAIEKLLKSDQADIEYSEWVRTASDLPDAFRHLSGINVKDRLQCVEQVFPHLRYSKGAIDYFLSHIIFPKEMKEFPHKISASGWDIGQIKTYPTTGFSGTNDSRHLLPTMVQQLDLLVQKHANALVLEYLLREENSVELLPQRARSAGSDAELLLATVTSMDPPVRVILDVGAQILELSSRVVAQEWLNMWPDHERTKAAVFFNVDDELSVLDREGHVEPLQISPYADQLDVCLVFLDEAHTRGTDLRLPTDYRAAVTLGANLTKDRLVQACMRMRRLGKGQSVVFCVTEEIEDKILERRLERNNAPIEVKDILSWAISETLVDLRRSMALWAAQGQRFEHQKLLWEAARCKDGFQFLKEQAEAFLEDEAQTLSQRYRPHTTSGCLNSSVLDAKSADLRRIHERCLEFGCLNFHSVSLQEEQERELSPEIEQECQVERPAPAEPEKHSIHSDVRTFVRTGTLVSHSPAFLPAFEALRSSSAVDHLDISQFPSDLLVTADFVRTVIPSGQKYISDSYQRSVQWILTSEDPRYGHIVKHIVIISPFEANELLPLIEGDRKVTLHTYKARHNAGFLPLDSLDLFTQGRLFNSIHVPPQFRLQLNLFAGQLYLGSFKEYTEVCTFLGLAWGPTEDGILVGADGFIIQALGERQFKDSPVKFLMVLMTKIRRNCEGIEKTHLGRMLQGSLLEQADFAL